VLAEMLKGFLIKLKKANFRTAEQVLNDLILHFQRCLNN
jgi:hypothetical protein